MNATGKNRFVGSVLLMAALMTVAVQVTVPATQAYANEAASAAMAAENDADADTSDALWFGAGCLLGLLGVLVAYVIEPSPPLVRLMGKSSEYVVFYTAAYKSAGKSAQGKNALYGCTAITILYVAASVAAAR